MSAGRILWIEPKYRRAFAGGTEDVYDSVARLGMADKFCKKQGRSTGRYDLDIAGTPLSIFLKRHEWIPWWMLYLAPQHWFPGPQELAHLQLVQKLGVQTPEPVIAGADRHHACRSFVATRELHGFMPVDEYVRSHLSGDVRGGRAALKRRLIERLAETTRRLHAARLYHQDLYLCHFYVAEDAAHKDGFQLAVIDFHRMIHSRRRRWQVKDLAQFLFSAEAAGLSTTDRLRFFKHYLGARRMGYRERLFWRRVLLKVAIYRRHNRRMQSRKRAA